MGVRTETEEILESGYGDSTPAGDNLVNDFARGEATAFGALAAARGDRVLEHDALQLTLLDSGSPAPYGNLAVARRLLVDVEWREAATVMHEFFAQQSGGPFMVFAGWPTPDLRPFGFGLVGHPPASGMPIGGVETPRWNPSVAVRPTLA